MTSRVRRPSKPARNYTPEEMMIVAAARELHEGDRVFVGIGLPVLSALLAQRDHAPDIVTIYEGGTIGSRPSRLAMTMGDPSLGSGCLAILDFFECFATMVQRGFVDVGFLGAAQVDRYGNMNSTVIGEYNKPTVRLPGSGGACEIAGNVKRFLIIIPHERKKFVERIDFRTSPGYLSGRDERQREGLRGGGPDAVISTLGVLRFDASGEMYLDSYHGGSSVSEVRENTGWKLKVSPKVRETPPPTEEQVRLLREELDPKGIFLRKPSA